MFLVGNGKWRPERVKVDLYHQNKDFLKSMGPKAVYIYIKYHSIYTN